jgi:hypothetical protein
MVKNQRRRTDTPDRVPLFEGIIVNLGDAGADSQAGLRIMRALAKRTGLEKWPVASVGPGSCNYVLIPFARVNADAQAAR